MRIHKMGGIRELRGFHVYNATRQDRVGSRVIDCWAIQARSGLSYFEVLWVPERDGRRSTAKSGPLSRILTGALDRHLVLRKSKAIEETEP